MSSRRWSYGRIGALVSIGCFVIAAAGRAQQFTSFNDRSRAVIEGNWLSCREGDGQYAERVYDGKWPGIGAFELHLGPFHDFALFRGVQDAHRDHNSPDNLLAPHTVELQQSRGRHTWSAAGMSLEVSLAGGSREECESWFVKLQPLSSSSH